MAFWNTKKPQTPPEPDIRTYEAEPPHYEPVEPMGCTASPPSGRTRR